MGAPSRRRREGREAFYPGGSPEDECRYSELGDIEDFVDGWNESLAEYEQQQKFENEEHEKWDQISGMCPWNDAGGCQPLADPKIKRIRVCIQENCPIWHFLEFNQF